MVATAVVATAGSRCRRLIDILRRWSCRKKPAPPAAEDARMDEAREQMEEDVDANPIAIPSSIRRICHQSGANRRRSRWHMKEADDDLGGSGDGGGIGEWRCHAGVCRGWKCVGEERGLSWLGGVWVDLVRFFCCVLKMNRVDSMRSDWVDSAINIFFFSV